MSKLAEILAQSYGEKRPMDQAQIESLFRAFFMARWGKNLRFPDSLFLEVMNKISELYDNAPLSSKDVDRAIEDVIFQKLGITRIS